MKTVKAQNSFKNLSRRTFLQASAVSAGALAVAGIHVPAFAARATTSRYPLHIPPLVSPSSYGLSAAPAQADLGDGRSASVLAYNNYFPGPSFRANKGDTATITFVNGLSEESIVHWHGMVVPEVAKLRRSARRKLSVSVSDQSARRSELVPPSSEYDDRRAGVPRTCRRIHHH